MDFKIHISSFPSNFSCPNQSCIYILRNFYTSVFYYFSQFSEFLEFRYSITSTTDCSFLSFPSNITPSFLFSFYVERKKKQTDYTPKKKVILRKAHSINKCY